MAVIIFLLSIYAIQIILALIEYLFDGGGIKRLIVHINPTLLFLAITSAFLDTRSKQ